MLRFLPASFFSMQQGQRPSRHSSQVGKFLDDGRTYMARMQSPAEMGDGSEWRWDNEGVVTTVMVADEERGIIIAGASDGDIAVWLPPKKKPLFISDRIHGGPITSLAAAPGNTMFASASSDGGVVIWPLDTNLEEDQLLPHNKIIDYDHPCRVASLPKEKDVFIVWETVGAGQDGAIDIFGPANDYQHPRWESSFRGLSCLAVRPDGKCLAVGTAEGTVHLRPINGCGLQDLGEELDAHGKAVVGIQYSHSGKRLLTSAIGQIKLWNLPPRGKKPITINGEDGHAIWSLDDRFIIVRGGSHMEQLHVYDSTDGHMVWSSRPHLSELSLLLPHPRDPTLVLTTGGDTTKHHIFVWKVKDDVRDDEPALCLTHGDDDDDRTKGIAPLTMSGPDRPCVGCFTFRGLTISDGEGNVHYWQWPLISPTALPSEEESRHTIVNEEHEDGGHRTWRLSQQDKILHRVQLGESMVFILENYPLAQLLPKGLPSACECTITEICPAYGYDPQSRMMVPQSWLCDLRKKVRKKVCT